MNWWLRDPRDYRVAAIRELDKPYHLRTVPPKLMADMALTILAAMTASAVMFVIGSVLIANSDGIRDQYLPLKVGIGCLVGYFAGHFIFWARLRDAVESKEG